MKNLKYTFLAIAALALASCDTNDDAFYNETYVRIPNLVQIESQPDYSVGDFLYVTADFSKVLNETGQSTPLDIFASTNGAQRFNFTYILEKQLTADQWEIVEISNNDLNIIDGAAESGSFVYAHAVYNPIDATYEYNVGIPLLSAGAYRLSFGYNSTDVDIVELRSETTGNNLFVNIESEVANLNPQGYYTFNVN